VILGVLAAATMLAVGVVPAFARFAGPNVVVAQATPTIAVTPSPGVVVEGSISAIATLARRRLKRTNHAALRQSAPIRRCQRQARTN
jgi:hypothetical protein